MPKVRMVVTHGSEGGNWKEIQGGDSVLSGLFFFLSVDYMVW